MKQKIPFWQIWDQGLQWERMTLGWELQIMSEKLLRQMKDSHAHPVQIFCWWLQTDRMKRQTEMYLLVLADLSAHLWIDHRFGDGPVKRADMKCKGCRLVNISVNQNLVCVCVCFIHGFGGEVLTEVPHDVEGVNSGSSENASSCLETQICDGSVGKQGSRWLDKRRGGDEETHKGAQRRRNTQRESVNKIKACVPESALSTNTPLGSVQGWGGGIEEQFIQQSALDEVCHGHPLSQAASMAEKVIS